MRWAGVAAGLALLVCLAGVVLVRSAATGAALSTMPVGVDPSAVAVDEQTGHAFVANRDGSISMLDATTGAFMRSIMLGATIAPLGLGAWHGRVYVATGTDLRELDARSGAVRRIMALAYGPDVVLPDGRAGGLIVGAIGVAAFGTGGFVSLLRVSSGTILHTIHQTLPLALAVDAATGRIYLAGSSGVQIYDGGSGRLLSSITCSLYPVALAVDAALHRLFAIDAANAGVVLFDTSAGRPLRTVHLGGNPVAIAIDARTARVFIANYGSNTMSVLDARTGRVLRSIPVGIAPMAVDVDAATGHVMVVNAGGSVPPTPPLQRMVRWLTPLLPGHLSVAPEAQPSTGSVTLVDESYL